MKIKFCGVISEIKKRTIKDGTITLYSNDIKHDQFKKIIDWQNKNNQEKELDIIVEYHYKKRSLDQNSLMWSLYTIEANEINGNMQGHTDQMVKPMDLYNQDILDYAPRIELLVNDKDIVTIRDDYKVIIESKYNDEKSKLTAIITSSKFNTIQMTDWIERLFNRLAYNGVSIQNSVEIKDYWLKWRNFTNDNKIDYHGAILSHIEYKRLNPICEATGKFIGDGSGHIAHIKARGMGGNHEAEKDYISNLLHLSFEPHILDQHGKGWNEFIKKYPHLSYKIQSALKKEIIN